MQTFLPYADFRKSAQCLDRQRLGKQRVECLQILKALNGLSKGWVSHPATLMWRGQELLLFEYMVEICIEWDSRGYRDTCLMKFYHLLFKDGGYPLPNSTPCWLGDQEFHDSHKSNLLRKNKEYYSQFGWDVPDNLLYKWHTKK